MSEAISQLASAVTGAKQGAQSAAADSSQPRNKKLDQLAENTVDLGGRNKVITTNTGAAVSNNTSWLKAGERGPLLLEDFHAREKIHHFDHERIPERVVHARGAGAHGIFEVTDPIPDLCLAPVLNDTSRRTPVFVRFSTVLGNRGAADTVRDVRGFAVKFYTDEGNWDIVGNNIPIFFHFDALRFVDLVHAGKPEPDLEIPQGQTAHNSFWDWISLTPEATHMSMWALSDRAIPRSYRMMNGAGVNTYRLVNAEGKSHYVKYHWIPDLGAHGLVWDEALKLQGQDPDFHRRDLAEAIAAGAFPTWKFGIQVMDPGDENNFSFDPLDATKIWPEEKFPIRFVGKLTLNKNPDEYFTETENVAFCTSNVVPGIDFSDDPLLQGRNFSYNDTQTSRLGSQNYNNSIPINRPVCPVMNFQRDNAFRTSITKGPNYYPNRFDALNGLAEPSYPALAHDQSVDGVPGQTAGMSKHIQQSVIGKGGFVHFPERIEGLKVKMNGQKFSNYYEQAQLFYNSMTPVEQEHIKAAAAFELGKCDDPIIWKRMVARYNHVNHEFAVWIAKELGVDPPSAPETYTSEKSAALSMIANNPRTIATRRIAIITLPGFDQAELTAIRSPLAAKGAMTFIIGARRGPVDGLATDFSLETCRSTMFDAVFLPLSSPAAGKVAAENGRVKHFIREQAGHQKPIAASGAPGAALVRSVLGDDIPEIAIATAGAQVVESHGIVTAADVSADPSKFVAAFENALREHRAWDRPGVARLAF